MQVVEQCAACVGGIGDVQRPARQLPEQPGVNSAEGQFAAPRPFAGARYMVQQPADLARGEISVNDQARLAGYKFAIAGALKIIAKPGCPAVLPDDGVMNRLSAPAVPNDRRLALISDADCRDVFGSQSRARQGRP